MQEKRNNPFTKQKKIDKKIQKKQTKQTKICHIFIILFYWSEIAH